MSATEPWAERWKVVENIGKGGQGFTFRVESRTQPGKFAVLKKLKNNEDAPARSRMHREVSNLQTLAVEGIKVPHVHDGNTKEFGSSGVQLYFVMEEITGATLREHVEKSGRLSIDESIAVAVDLCETIAKAHKRNVLHRDLKPDNIIIRNQASSDAVIVDYGLSFNREGQDSITVTGEAFKSSFLALPETNTPTGDHRDFRSDATAIVAILFYCLTGKIPGQLLDGGNLPPHRRQGSTLGALHPNDLRVRDLNLIFDMGFSVDLNARFSSVDDLTVRIRTAQRAAFSTKLEKPADVAREIRESMQATDRKTQLQSMKEACQKALPWFLQHVQSLGDLLPFQINPNMGGQFPGPIPQGCDNLNIAFVYALSLSIHDLSRVIHFGFAAKGNQCVILSITKSPHNAGTRRQGIVGARETVGPRLNPNEAPPSKELFWFDPFQPLDENVLGQIVDAVITETMREMHLAASQS